MIVIASFKRSDDNVSGLECMHPVAFDGIGVASSPACTKTPNENYSKHGYPCKTSLEFTASEFQYWVDSSLGCIGIRYHFKVYGNEKRMLCIHDKSSEQSTDGH